MAKPQRTPDADLRTTLLGVSLGLLPIAVAVSVTAAGKGDLGRALLFLLPVLAIGLFAALVGWAQDRARARWDRDHRAGRVRWWQPRP